MREARVSPPPSRTTEGDLRPRTTTIPPAIARGAVALSLAALSISATGCMRKSHVAVRAAANTDDEAKPPRFFPPPLAIAAPEDAIVRVIGPQMTCSGTLVEEDLVLTAHHCVVERESDGNFTKTEVQPSKMRVELGGDYLAWGSVAVSHIVAPPCGESGGAGDVAVLVLDRKVVGLGTMPARLDEPPKVGEPLDPAGFGRCAMSGDGIHRSVRVGGSVEKLGVGTIRMTASICPGDSGGPVFARGSHQVVGVVSLSAMDADEKTASPSIMARVDDYRMVFAHARLIADGMSAGELPPLSCAR